MQIYPEYILRLLTLTALLIMRNKIYIIVLAVIAVVMSTVFIHEHVKQGRLMGGDIMGYYLYLPGAFIYQNLQHVEHVPEEYNIPDYAQRYYNSLGTDAVRSNSGKAVNQYTYGIALLEAPFFFIAHAYEKVTGKPANGYSDTYEFMIRVSTIFYAVLGLLLVYLILIRYFNTSIAAITTFLVFVATNLFWFTVSQAGMSHVPLFFLFAAIIYYSIKVYERPLVKYFAILGFTVGLITVIRPTDIMCVLIPLLYGITNKATLRERVTFIKTHAKKIVLAMCVAIVPILPQLFYWKSLTGSFIFYSYGEQGFTWTDPKIIQGLFYFSNGWFAYTPIMLFAIVGLFLYKHIRPWLLPTVAILPIYVYVIYSWYCFNYINGLGSRPMIHLYALLAIPLAAFINYVAKKGWIVKVLCTILFVFFISTNYSFSMLKGRGMLYSEEANFEYCSSVLYKSYLDYDDLVCYDIGVIQPEDNEVEKVRTLAMRSFEDSVSFHYKPNKGGEGEYVYFVANWEEFPGAILKTVYSEKEFGAAKWIKCSGLFKIDDWPDVPKNILSFVVQRNEETVMWKGCKINNKIGLADSSCGHNTQKLQLEHYELGKWGEVSYFVQLPEDMHDGDTLNLHVWNLHHHEMYVDDLKLELYKDKN